MSDYARQNDGATHWADRDGRSTGDANKRVVGAHFDTEFNAVLTAVNSKYDSDDLADQAAAEGESLTTKLLAPKSLAFWSDDNGGVVGELQALAAPVADGLLGWDYGAAADANVIFFTAGTGLAITGTEVLLSHLGLEALTDPGADRIMFLDDVGGAALAWLQLGTNLSISATTLSYDLATALDGADVSGVTTMSIEDLDQSADGIMMNDGGVIKVMPIDEAGIDVIETANASQTFAITDANTMQVLTGLAVADKTFTIPLNAVVAFKIGTIIVINDRDGFGGSYNLKVAISSTGLISSFLRDTAETGAGESTHTIIKGGSAIAVKIATDQWTLVGDIV